MVLLIKLWLALALIIVTLAWGIIYRLMGVTEDLTLLGMLCLFGIGVLLGTLWEDKD